MHRESIDFLCIDFKPFLYHIFIFLPTFLVIFPLSLALVLLFLVEDTCTCSVSFFEFYTGRISKFGIHC